MTKEKSALRQALEAAIGDREIIIRPDGLVRGKWGANEQADAVEVLVLVVVEDDRVCERRVGGPVVGLERQSARGVGAAATAGATGSVASPNSLR